MSVRRRSAGARTGLAATLLPVVAVVLAASAPAPASAQTVETSGRMLEAVRVSLEGQEMVLPALVEADGAYVSLKAAAAAVGARFERPAEGRYLLATAAGSADFSVARPALVLLDARPAPGAERAAAASGRRTLSLGADAIEKDGDLFVPRDALGRVLARLAETPAAPPAAATGAPRWALTGAGDGRLRLDLGLAEIPASVTTTRESGGDHVVRVPLDAPFTPPWPAKTFESALIESLEARVDGGVLAIRIAGGPRLADVRATRRDAPPGVEILLVGAEDAAAPSPAAYAQAKGPVKRVVIDPGHGGEEEGAVGPNGLLEKELVLDVARRLASLLRLEGFDVLLTRNADVDLPLDERAAVANEHRADLFVSLHANASRFSGAFGAETFYLATEATDDEARTLAALENDSARVDAGGRVQGTGELPLILWDMAQVAYLQESARLAETIQRRLNDLLGIRDRGVRQAPFRVLVGATCPAVLVELGFVTNRDEAARLASGDHRQRLAEALRDAISTFRGARVAPAAGVSP